MTDFITLSCPSCGGKLQITSDIERFACSHCGNEHVVKRGGGIVSLAPIMEGLKQVQASTDRVAIELAVQRLTSELAEAQGRIDAAKAKLQGARMKEVQSNGLIWNLADIFLTFFAVMFLLVACAAFAGATNAGTLPSANGTPTYFCIGAALGLIGAVRWSGRSSVRKARLAAQADVSQAEAYYATLLERRNQQRALAER